MKVAGRIWKRLVNAHAGCVALVVLLANMTFVASIQQHGRVSMLGYAIHQVLPGGYWIGGRTTSDRPFGDGESWDLRPNSAGIRSSVPDLCHWLSYTFAAVEREDGTFEVYSTQHIIERFGRDVAERVDTAYRTGGQSRSPLVLEPGTEADFLLCINLYFAKSGVWAPTTSWSDLSIAVVPLNASDRPRLGQTVPRDGDLERRYVALMEETAATLRALSPDEFVPDGDWPTAFRDPGTPQTVRDNFPTFLNSIANSGSGYVESGRIESPLLRGWLLTIAGVVSLLWFLVCLPSMALALYRAYRRRVRKAYQCLKCGYDRRGTDSNAPCPECGHAPQAGS